MTLLCRIGIHSWQERCTCKHCGACRERGHDWNACICRQCKRTREEGHQWDGCLCVNCGGKRNANHTWKSCLCARCGQEHDWKEHSEERGFGSLAPTGIDSSSGFAYLAPAYETFKECKLCGEKVSTGSFIDDSHFSKI